MVAPTIAALNELPEVPAAMFVSMLSRIASRLAKSVAFTELMVVSGCWGVTLVGAVVVLAVVSVGAEDVSDGTSALLQPVKPVKLMASVNVVTIIVDNIFFFIDVAPLLIIL